MDKRHSAIGDLSLAFRSRRMDDSLRPEPQVARFNGVTPKHSDVEDWEDTSPRDLGRPNASSSNGIQGLAPVFLLLFRAPTVLPLPSCADVSASSVNTATALVGNSSHVLTNSSSLKSGRL